MRATLLTIVVAVLVGTAGSSAAAEDLALKGEIVELSCYSKLGVAGGTGVAHIACAKECVAKGQALGILTDGEGLIKITGSFAENKYGKLVEHIGRQVELRGTDARYLDYSRAINVSRVIPSSGGPAGR